MSKPPTSLSAEGSPEPSATLPAPDSRATLRPSLQEEGAAPSYLPRPALSKTYLDARQKAIREVRITEDGHVRSRFDGYLAGSFSSIWKYRECPRMYRLGIEAGLDLSGDAADRGTELHSVAESAQQGVEHVESGTLPLTGTDKYFELKRKILEAGATEGAKTEQELFVEWQVTPELRFQLRAFIDFLVLDPAKGSFSFEDYKTGRAQKYDEHEYQRFIYALSVVRNYVDYWRGQGMTTYLQWQEPHRGKVQNFKADQVEEFAVALEAQVRAMAEDTEFKPKPGLKRCSLCDFKHKCDAAQKLLSPYRLELPVTRKVVKKRGSVVLEETEHKGEFVIQVPAGIASRDDLVAMAQALFQLDALRAALVAQLKEGVARNQQPVEIPGEGVMYGSFDKTTKTIRDIDGLLAVAHEMGIPYSEIVRFNAQQGKKYLDQHPVLAEMAEEYTERYPVWDFRKIDPEKPATEAEGDEGAAA